MAAVAHHLRADLDQLLPQARQRPILDRFRRCQGAQKIAEIVGERMKLEPNDIGSERPARQPRPLDRALAFLNPLFACAALVVEAERSAGRDRLFLVTIFDCSSLKYNRSNGRTEFRHGRRDSDIGISTLSWIERERRWRTQRG